jgi:hypothetical protein
MLVKRDFCMSQPPSAPDERGRDIRLIRAGIYAVAGLALFFVMLSRVDDYGVSWDEGFFKFPGAWIQAKWFADLGPWSFTESAIDAGFETRSQHPSLHRSVMALTWLALHRGLGIPELTAFRIPQAIYFVVIVLVSSWVVERRAGPWGAAATFGAFVAMPRVWGLAHLACLDTVIAVVWLAVVLVFDWAARRDGWLPALAFGVLYGLAFATKLHAVFIPFPLVLYWLIYRPKGAWKCAICAFAAAPILFIALQPGLWIDPASRIAEQFANYIEKEGFASVRTYYFGTVYEHRAPWSYVPVMFATTIPLFLLMALVYGTVRTLSRWREQAFGGLLLLNLSVALCLFMLPKAGIYDGVRLFLPAFYFAALIVGLGVGAFAEELRATRWRPAAQHGVLAAVLALCVFPGVVSSARLHPAELSYHNALLGGVYGAHRYGMQTTYWGETVNRDFLAKVDQALFPGARVRTLAIPTAAILYAERNGWLRDDIIINGEPPYDFHLMQNRQSFFGRIEWHIYEYQEPIVAMERDGVVICALYGDLAVGE